MKRLLMVVLTIIVFQSGLMADMKILPWAEFDLGMGVYTADNVVVCANSSDRLNSQESIAKICLAQFGDNSIFIRFDNLFYTISSFPGGVSFSPILSQFGTQLGYEYSLSPDLNLYLIYEHLCSHKTITDGLNWVRADIILKSDIDNYDKIQFGIKFKFER